jgi:hypothetical protein
MHVAEIENIMEIGKEANDDFAGHDDEWSGSDHLEEPIEEVNERTKHLQFRLEDASTLIKEKASRIHELKTTASTKYFPKKRDVPKPVQREWEVKKYMKQKK